MLIRNKDRQRLLEIFLSSGLPIEVWAYGSRVTGTAHEGSDLDLVVRSQSEEKLPSGLLAGLRDKIKYSNIPIMVELFDWHRIPESFQQNITEQHEVLFSNFGALVNEPEPGYKEHRGEE